LIQQQQQQQQQQGGRGAVGSRLTVPDWRTDALEQQQQQRGQEQQAGPKPASQPASDRSTMAYRSSGADNAELAHNLRGKLS